MSKNIQNCHDFLADKCKQEYFIVMLQFELIQKNQQVKKVNKLKWSDRRLITLTFMLDGNS